MQFGQLKRRELITLIGGAVIARPLLAHAQSPTKLSIIGFLVSTPRSFTGEWISAFAVRLRELNWVEDRNITIEYRWAEGNTQSMAKIASEFARRRVDIFVAQGTQAAAAAKEATSTIPIVFILVGDPIGSGLAKSLNHPGENVTGLSSQSTDLAGKRLEIFRELVPGFRRLGVLVNVENPSAVLDRTQLKAAAKTLSVDIVSVEIQRAEDIGPAMETFKGRVDALYSAPDALVHTNLSQINAAALSAHLPTMFGAPSYAKAGGLVSYGTSFLEMFRHAADYVDKILRGAKPGDIPVEQPTKFDLVINISTAKSLGLVVPPTLLALADEVIE